MLLAKMQGKEEEASRWYGLWDQLIDQNEPTFQEVLDVYRVHEVLKHYACKPWRLGRWSAF